MDVSLLPLVNTEAPLLIEHIWKGHLIAWCMGYAHSFEAGYISIDMYYFQFSYSKPTHTTFAHKCTTDVQESRHELMLQVHLETSVHARSS